MAFTGNGFPTERDKKTKKTTTTNHRYEYSEIALQLIALKWNIFQFSFILQ